MNKSKEYVDFKSALKNLFKFTEEMKYQDIPLKDGSKLSIADGAELATGVEIYLIDEQGNQTPAEDGSVDLADGRTIVIKAGVVDSISDSATPPTGDSPQDPANVSDPAAVANAATDPGAAPVDDDSDLETRVSALEAQLAQVQELLQGMQNSQEVAMTAIDESPAVESIRDTPSLDVTKEVKLSRESRKLPVEQREFLQDVMNMKNRLKNGKAANGMLSGKGGSLREEMAALKNKKK